jgi:hypothetical protein
MLYNDTVIRWIMPRKFEASNDSFEYQDPMFTKSTMNAGMHDGNVGNSKYPTNNAEG